MKKTFLIIFLLKLSFWTSAQQNLYPDTLKRDLKTNYVLVYRDCPGCEINKYIKHYFNDKGLHYKREYFDSSNSVRGKITYNYDQGRLTSYENYGSYKATTPDYEEFVWDSTQRSQTVLYKYNNNILNQLIWLNEENSSEFDIVLTYDKNNRITKEILTEYSYPNRITFQAFKPNSFEFTDSIKTYGNAIRQKLYDYRNSNCTILYSVNDQATGTEKGKLTLKYVL